MKLIPEAKRAWRMFSVQAGAAIVLLPVVWLELPQDLKDMIPVEWKPWIVSSMGAAVVIGRLIQQRGLRE